MGSRRKEYYYYYFFFFLFQIIRISERSQPVERGCRWSRGVGRAFPTYYIYASGNTIRICLRYIINYYYFLRSSRLLSVYCIIRRHIFDVHILHCMCAYACVRTCGSVAGNGVLGFDV